MKKLFLQAISMPFYFKKAGFTFLLLFLSISTFAQPVFEDDVDDEGPQASIEHYIYPALAATLFLGFYVTRNKKTFITKNN